MHERSEEAVLKWFGHMERISDKRMTKRVYISEMEGIRKKGKLMKVWKN